MRKRYLLSWITGVLLVLAGCGESGGKSSNAQETNGTSVSAKGGEGVVYDAPVAGLQYECGSKKALTGSDGGFSCNTMPVLFKVGDLPIARLNQMTPDGIVFPQDLMGIGRDNMTDSRLIGLVRFLQALDDDGNIDERINISEAKREAFKGKSGSTLASEADWESNAGKGGLLLSSPEVAMAHLYRAMHSDEEKPKPSTFAGQWIGTAGGWEIRFVQKAGEFVSSMAGSDASKLPFSGEKVIMSLMVTHEAMFTLDVDADGKIIGEGYITYNLIPNLCGLHALTTQVNSAVNMMGVIPTLFELSGFVKQGAVEDFIKEHSPFRAQVLNEALSAYMAGNSVASILNADVGNLLAARAQQVSAEGEREQQMCLAAADIAAHGGGQQLGPKTFRGLVEDGAINILKGFISGYDRPFGFVLSVPGVTQIQYYYKGLENGPETRYFTISGHVADGKMFLEVDKMQTPFDLPLVWQVNYKTERATFPVWSPFRDAGGVLHPANTEVLLSDFKDVTVDAPYVDYDDGNTKKTVSVTMKKLIAQWKTLPFVSATFSETGTHRDGKQVWHEYEYDWNAYRVSE